VNILASLNGKHFTSQNQEPWGCSVDLNLFSTFKKISIFQFIRNFSFYWQTFWIKTNIIEAQKWSLRCSIYWVHHHIQILFSLLLKKTFSRNMLNKTMWRVIENANEKIA